MASESPTHAGSASASGGKKCRVLRPEEFVQLKDRLNEFSAEATKIEPEEIEFKKGLIRWLKETIKNYGMDRHIFRTFNSGSAYEKLQAGEATDFDIMFFLNIKRWNWKWEDDKHNPGYCTITRVKREGDNDRSYKHLVDDENRLSALKVRRWYTSKIDRVLYKKSPLMYKYNVKVKKEGEAGEPAAEEVEKREVEIKVSRKQKGPATTLLIEVEKHRPFTLDIVHTIHSTHVTPHPHCDFVAKPCNKQNLYDEDFAHLWRKSYSREETKRLKSIDEGNKVHRKLLRIMKILGRNQPQLKFLPTYFYKTLILHLSDEESTNIDEAGSSAPTWMEEDLAHRFVDIIIKLRDCLDDKNLPIYFSKKINLLGFYTKTEPLEHVAGYLRRIANKGLPGYEEMLKTETKSHQCTEMNLRERRKRKRKNRAKRQSENKKTTSKKPTVNRRKKARMAVLMKTDKPADWIPPLEKKPRAISGSKTKGKGKPATGKATANGAAIALLDANESESPSVTSTGDRLLESEDYLSGVVDSPSGVDVDSPATAGFDDELLPEDPLQNSPDYGDDYSPDNLDYNSDNDFDPDGFLEYDDMGNASGDDFGNGFDNDFDDDFGDDFSNDFDNDFGGGYDSDNY